MKFFKSITGTNLFILLGYTLLAGIINSSPSVKHHEYLSAIILITFISLQVIINFIISIIQFIKKNPESGKQYLLSAGLVLVIGFSSCYGILK